MGKETSTTSKPAWAVAMKARREEVGVSQEEMAIQADVSQSLISQIERGVQNPTGVSVERFGRILHTLHWSTNEFAQSTGLALPHITSEMPVSAFAIEAEQSLYSPPKPKSAFAVENELWGMKTARDEVSPVSNVHRVPVMGMAAAGYGVDVSEEEPIAYGYVNPANYREHMLILQVDGDSMSASGEVNSLQAGDWIYVDPRLLDLQDNKIFVVYVPGQGVLVKRVRQWPQGWMLTSDNNEYPPFAADEAQIIGRVYYRQPRGERL